MYLAQNHNPKLRNGSVEFPARIVYVWTLVFISMVIYAITWFALGGAAIKIIDALTPLVTGDSMWTSVVGLVKYLVLLHPIISLIGWIVWGFLNSMRRDRQSWEQV